MKKVVVISVHPDDETLGCGGTILKHLRGGDEVHCILVTSGNEKQKEVWKEVKTAYGFTSTIELDFPELDLADISLNQIIPALTQVISRIKPSILYIPNRSDIHSDHRAVFEACLPLVKNFRFPFVKNVMMMEVLSETEYSSILVRECFSPNYFVDISDFMDEKLFILSKYSSEIMGESEPRSERVVKALAAYRGSRIGVKYAESFVKVFEMW